MTVNEIREKFLKFFESKGSTIVASDSLVPKDDPTVLFTTAGMQQFKRQFLGQVDDYTAATTSQKCMRTDDLDEVGKTDFHHTFFEMLGNFSFGDYFKKEAINWAWEFLTKELNISEDRLWVSVNKDDKEAKEIWLKDIGLPEHKIFTLGDKSNFWPSNAREAGPNGPCGPCSEIFYDYNPDDETIPKDPDDIDGRFSEIWNLVFTQFERKDGGELVPLPNKNIDTGMGLERLCSVLQGKKNNFDTDIFVPILKAINTEIGDIDLRRKRIIADHIRGITFGINDGVVPSNEGRGYVIKKLIIIASDIAQSYGKTKACIYKLVPSVVESMGQMYPDLLKTSSNISDTIKSIEEAYIKVRLEKIPEFIKELEKVQKTKLSLADLAMQLGDLLFKYRDTYGLTIDTLDRIMHERDSELESHREVPMNAWKRFHDLLAEQQERARSSSKMMGDVFTDTALDHNLPKTVFWGYQQNATSGRVLKIIVNDQAATEAKEGDNVSIVLNETSFYAESGGQIGDAGTLTRGDDVFINITDTKKIGDIFVHIGKIEKGSIKEGDTLTGKFDADRRMDVKRNHTATHILQCALRKILGAHVQQQGSFVDTERLRFDFTHPKALTTEEIINIEKYANKLIRQCDPVEKNVMSIHEAKETGALAFFAEKYGDKVRVVSIGDYSKEFCGGTHLDSTGQIGLFKIISESAIAQGIRRIEGATGVGAHAFTCEQALIIEQAAQALKAPANELVDRIKAQTQKIKQLEKDLEAAQFDAVKNSTDDILANAETINNIKLINHVFKNIEMGILRKIADLLKQKTSSAIITLGAKTTENASILILVTDDLVKKGIKANELIKKIAPLMDGSGGGRPQLAQAGSKAVDKVDHAVQQANKIIKESVKL